MPPLPPTRYISAGPGMPLASPSTAMASSEAMARMGNTIAAVGEKGLEIAEKVRRMEEAGKMSAFFANLDEEAAQFSNQLMTRHDTAAWPAEWKEKTADMQGRLKELGISPEGMTRANLEFGEWASRRSIQFETQAASKAVEMARMQVVNAMHYHGGRGETEAARREADRARDAGIFNPPEHEKALQELDEMSMQSELDADIDLDPAKVITRLEDRNSFISANPGATLEMVERAKRRALIKAEEYRASELDQIESAIEAGKFKGSDLEAARYVTDKDIRSIKSALAQKEPPSNEIHAKAWSLLSDLRQMRDDPSVSDDQYRHRWNESRAVVLGGIAPQWQGDIKKELNYLSPAGRGPGGMNVRTNEDLEALGRDQAKRALDSGVFGDVSSELPYAKKEPAFRKFEDIRRAVKDYVRKTPGAGPEEVRKFTDSLISGDTAAAASKKITIPGAGVSMRPMPGMEGGSPGMAGSVLPPLDDLENEFQDTITP